MGIKIWSLESHSSWGWASRQNSLYMIESLSANTKWLETINLLFNLFTTYFMKGKEKASFQNFPHGIVSDYLVGISNHFVLASGRRFSLPAPFQDDIWNNAKLAPKCPTIIFLCFSINQIWENKPNVSKQDWHIYKRKKIYGF